MVRIAAGCNTPAEHDGWGKPRRTVVAVYSRQALTESPTSCSLPCTAKLVAPMLASPDRAAAPLANIGYRAA
jgi:hypothetical protein